MTPIERVADRRRRVAAAGIVAVVSVVIAAAAHAAAGGGTPSIVALALALLIAGGIGMGVVGTRPGRVRVALGVALDQAVFHTLFGFFGMSIVTGAPAVDAHALHAAPVLDAVAAAAATPSIAMIVTHLGAALLAYGMLRRGLSAIEAAAAALEAALARALSPVATLPAPTTAPRLTPVVDARPVLTTEAERLPDRRGPPALVAR